VQLIGLIKSSGDIMIRKEGTQYILYSKDGSRKLGTFPSRKQAEERDKQITRIKYAKGK
jgi:hypothetical protein